MGFRLSAYLFRAWIIASLLALLLSFGAGHLVASPLPREPDSVKLDIPITQPIFIDVTASSGIAFTYFNGEEADQYKLLESLGGGSALLAYDGDGLLDLFFTGGGRFEGPDKHQILGCPCKLFRNLGNRKFKDVTAEVGLERPWFYTHGVAAAAYDNDGWPDLLVTGWPHLALFHNEPVDPKEPAKARTFVEVSRRAGLPEGLWTLSAAWGDLDGDGYVDLYMVQYLDWSFESNNPFCNYDGKSGIYVANDTVDNFLYLNRGSHPGHLQLEERGLEAGTALDGVGEPEGSMGIDAADYDSSARPTLFVTNYEHDRLSCFPMMPTRRAVIGSAWDYEAHAIETWSGRVFCWKPQGERKRVLPRAAAAMPHPVIAATFSDSAPATALINSQLSGLRDALKSERQSHPIAIGG